MYFRHYCATFRYFRREVTRSELTFREVRSGVTLVVAMREVTEETVAFLRVAADGHVSQKPS